MFQKLVNHNSDIQQLLDKGYAIAFDSNYLIVRDIPYLDNDLNLQIGAIVTKIEFIDQERIKQQDHQIFFAGSVPYGLDSKPIPNLAGGTTQLHLSENCKDVVVQRSFSNKPKDKNGNLREYKDFFEKLESYVSIISGPAMHKYDVSPYTFRAVKEIVSDTIFKFHDTLTSRAEITDLAENFKNDVVAVIGIGGTGAYVLDFLVKTRIPEIRVFDNDLFHVHNAFRSPGRTDKEEFDKPKTDIYLKRYENFRNGLTVKRRLIDDSSSEEFNGVTFAFVCVDKGTSRRAIFDILISEGIPFIDVGMGLNRKKGPIDGMLRTTYYSAEHGGKVRDKNLAPVVDERDDVYRTNIQIAELNALNACIAVLKFKQLRGFYVEEDPYYNLLFKIGDLMSVGESELNEN